MSQVPIPAWNAMQVLPPVNDVDPVSPDRSPYEVSLLSVVIRFATSWQRCKILRGFLGFRATLDKAGITSGFQWVDGSFSENVEVLEARNPRDVDVVSFLDDPNGDLGRKFPGALADHGEVKKIFLVDVYWVETTLPGRNLVTLSAYWYSIWAHRRNSQWKGFLQIDLDPAEDADALAELTQIEAGLVPPAPPAGSPQRGQP